MIESTGYTAERPAPPGPAPSPGSGSSFLTIKNLSCTPDELIAARSPVAGHVVLTERSGLAAARTVVGALAIPAMGYLLILLL